MTFHDRLYLTISVILALVPFAVSLYFLLRRKTAVEVSGWRYRATIAGLVLAMIASLPTPTFFLALELPWSAQSQWVPLAAVRYMPLGLIVGLVAMILLAFSRGRVRWLGMAMTFLSVALLYVTLLGLSE
jgi:hypothetical protein